MCSNKSEDSYQNYTLSRQGNYTCGRDLSEFAARSGPIDAGEGDGMYGGLHRGRETFDAASTQQKT